MEGTASALKVMSKGRELVLELVHVAHQLQVLVIQPEMVQHEVEDYQKISDPSTMNCRSTQH